MAKVLFLQNMDYELVGPMYLSSMLKPHGHKCELSIGHKLKDFSDLIESFQPDFFGFSIMSGSHSWTLKVARKIKEKYQILNVLGLADETLEDVFSTVLLNIKIKAGYPWCSIFSPFPGTELSEYAYAKGYLSPTFNVEELDKSFFISSQLELPNIKEMRNLQNFFQTAVLRPWTSPLIKKFISLPPNILFRASFGLLCFYVYIKSEKRNFWETLKFAVGNYKHVLAKE